MPPRKVKPELVNGVLTVFSHYVDRQKDFVCLDFSGTSTVILEDRFILGLFVM